VWCRLHTFDQPWVCQTRQQPDPQTTNPRGSSPGDLQQKANFPLCTPKDTETVSDDLRNHLLRSGCEVPHSPGQLSAELSKLILVALADHANHKRILWVSNRTLAKELDLSPTTIWSALKLYKAAGILTPTGSRKGKGGSIVYEMTVEHLPVTNPWYKPIQQQSDSHAWNSSDSEPQETDQGSTPPTDQGTVSGSDQRTDQGTVSPIWVQKQKHLQKQKPNHSQADLEALFDQALEIELTFRPSQVPVSKLKEMKRASYLTACERVLNRYPNASPATNPDSELALAVCHETNDGHPCLTIGTSTRQALERRYNPQQPPEPPQTPTPEQIERMKAMRRNPSWTDQAS
jgi:hypothetical protein